FVTYKVEISEDEIIEAGQLFYHEDAEKLDAIVRRVMDMVGCDEDCAEELLSERLDIWEMDTGLDPMDLGETAWDIQRLTGEAAFLLGYRAVELQDEQGAAWLVNMEGRVGELVEMMEA